MSTQRDPNGPDGCSQSSERASTSLAPLRFRILSYKGEWFIGYTRKTGKLEPWEYGERRIAIIFPNRRSAREWYRFYILGKGEELPDERSRGNQ